MFITDYDCEEVRKEACKVLKNFGVKQRLKKIDQKECEKKTVGVFKIHLEKLCQKKVKIKQSEHLIPVPAFVVEACNYLRDTIDTEGIFRRSGVVVRQKELKQILLSGGRLSAGDYKATDVADLLKKFFRELPEPCIPYVFHETLQKCFDILEKCKDAIFLTLLLLPPTYLFTLAYLMQFLQDVTTHSNNNQMDASNLSIVWTPNLMPFKTGQVNDKQVIEKRLAIIQLLIENSSLIGVVPECLYDSLHSWQPSYSLSSHDELENSRHREKKKKRRSGSLTRMLSGIKKMVRGKVSEEIEVSTPENSTTSITHTPCIMSTGKKRKASESNLTSFSAKKRRELLESLPQRSLLPDIYTTTHLTPRVLLPQPAGGNVILGEPEVKHRSRFYTNTNNDREIGKKSLRSLSASRLRLSHFGFSRKHAKKVMKNDDSGVDLAATSTPDQLDQTSHSDDFVRISRSEYEDIKNRVSIIESRISSEFENIVGVSMSDLEETPIKSSLENLKTVQSVYEKTLESSEKFNSPTTDELAKRLSRELKIRGSSEKKVIRSPSARKIGSLRRRSRDKAPAIRRNLSLNIPDRVNTSHSFYPVALKRGKPNARSNGLLNPSLVSVDKSQENFENFTNQLKLESYESQQDSCNGSFGPGSFDLTSFGVLTRSQTRRASSFHGCDFSNLANTTHCSSSETRNKSSDSIMWKNAETFLKEERPVETSVTGRPSLAKIRSQNAGMVLEKAKMFNTLITSDNDKTNKKTCGKSNEIRKRNSSRSSKERRLQRKRSGNQKSERGNQVPEENLKSSNGMRATPERKCTKSRTVKDDLKENFPKKCVKTSESSSNKPVLYSNKTLASCQRQLTQKSPLCVNKLKNHPHINSPLRERNEFNSPIGSARRLPVKKCTPKVTRQVSCGDRPSFVKSVSSTTPRRSPRQHLYKAKNPIKLS